YLFQTGANTNQVSVRLDWSTSGVDLDLYLFPATHTFPILTSAAMSTTNLDEFGTSAVTPNTQYWVSVGAASDSTTTDLPANYGITVCGEHFVQGP
ncbi:MAG TPA: hypothetical protein VH143_24275, partial [Kofleriaceae bacterium]|nr:hypothetical protein [Kofleriaceae bacterium]